MPKQDHHFVATTAFSWEAAESKDAARRAIERAVEGVPVGITFTDVTYTIWQVPLPLDASYEFDHFKPQVEDVKRVERGILNQREAEI